MIDYKNDNIETKKGIFVRSKYEKRFAEFLDFHNIRNIYEKPLVLSNGDLVHPDFYLPEYDCYVEIWGMSGVGSYDWKRGYKRARYHEDNIKIIELWPNDWKNFKWLFKKKFEEILGIPFPSRKFIPYYR